MIVAFGSLAAVVTASLVWTTTLMERSIETVIRDSESQAIASEIQLALLTHQRLRNLYVMFHEPEVYDTARELVIETRGLLARAEQYRGSADEQRLLDEVSRRLTFYLEERERLEDHETELEEVVRLSQPALDDTVHALEALHDLNDDQVRLADAEAQQVNEQANLMGSIAATVLVLGLTAVAVGIRHYVLRPVLALHETIGRFKAGETDGRAHDDGLSELAELALGFNEMAEGLAQQREAQLTFLAGVAHDLRNPLNAIKIGIYALEVEQSEARRGRARERLDRQVDRLARMVDDLLDATRIEAGKLEMRVEPMDLRDVVQDMVRLYAPTSSEHQITAHVPGERVVVQGDPLRLEQVVSNLVSNAIKFSPEGGSIEVVVRTEGDDAILSVTDRGVGIPHGELSSVFLPFRRRRPEVAPGAGLGLSVVRRIVMAHRGSIDVESEPGRGASFRVKLPRVGVC
ncbi:HAMP domain-containing sensor histidine kinase [Paraliomyxa miuraensis]|uniref:HAMP domain-containing sensor histidine kinase n=1 Tax=Paraliomyxa miuraensis TaxID=376150 RepID=UPI002256F894|nr:sensor histidine kinase [Paraliomyxa miuraensis]